MTVTMNTTTVGPYAISSTDAGQIAWSIDGGEEHTLDLYPGWVAKGTVAKDNYFVRNFLLATGLPRADHVLKLRVVPHSERSDGNVVRLGGFCVTNPKP